MRITSCFSLQREGGIAFRHAERAFLDRGRACRSRRGGTGLCRKTSARRPQQHRVPGRDAGRPAGPEDLRRRYGHAAVRQPAGRRGPRPCRAVRDRPGAAACGPGPDSWQGMGALPLGRRGDFAAPFAGLGRHCLVQAPRDPAAGPAANDFRAGGNSGRGDARGTCGAAAQAARLAASRAAGPGRERLPARRPCARKPGGLAGRGAPDRLAMSCGGRPGFRHRALPVPGDAAGARRADPVGGREARLLRGLRRPAAKGRWAEAAPFMAWRMALYCAWRAERGDAAYRPGIAVELGL